MRRPTRIDVLALAFVVGSALTGGAAMLVLGQLRVPGFVASVAWSANRLPGATPDDDLHPPLDVAAFRAWFAPRIAADEPFQHVGATVIESPAGVTVRLEARARTPWAAARRAEGAALVVEAWDREAAAEHRAREIAALDAQAEVLTTSIRTLQVGDAAGVSADIATEVAERDAVVRRRETLAAVGAGSAASGALTRSGDASWRVERPLVWTVAGATATGAAMAVGALLLVSFLPRRAVGSSRRGVRSTSDVLAIVPGAPLHAAEASKEAVVKLRARLFAATRGFSTRVFLITAIPGVDGKSAIVCRLAEALALHGSRTLLVDAVLSAPSLADRYFGGRRPAEPVVGSDVASTLTWIEDPEGDHRVATIVVGGHVTFDLVPQARPIWLAPGTAETFYRGLQRVLERWDGYDAIVIDAPEVTAGGDLRWIAEHASGVVLVVEPAQVHDAGAARRAQRATEAPLLGLVVSDPDPAASAGSSPEGSPTPPRRRGGRWRRRSGSPVLLVPPPLRSALRIVPR